MANLIYLNLGKRRIQDKLSNVAGGKIEDGLAVHAFASAHTIVNTDLLATYTAIEASFSGYAAGTIGGEVASTLDGSNRATTTTTPITFTNSSAGSVNLYGIYITDSVPSEVYVAAVFDGAPLSIPAGGSITVNLVLTTQSEF